MYGAIASFSKSLTFIPEEMYQLMDNEIVQLIARFISLSEEEADLIAACIPIRSYPKGTVLLREGQVSQESYFTISGCVRQYYIVDGEERTTAFYMEDDAISSLTSYLKKTPADHFLSCVEDCRLAVLTSDKEQELCSKMPGFESLCRVSMEEDFGRQQKKLAQNLTLSAEERYLELLDNQPGLVQRVPQYQLASYLGVKPESLSRIRKRLARKAE